MLDSGLEGVIDSAQGLHPMFAVARCPVGSLTRWHAAATAAAGRKRKKMIPKRFRDRREAGRLLAGKLTGYATRPDVLVLALPRGGVPVAYEVALALRAPLEVFLVRKLGVPGHDELAMGPSRLMGCAFSTKRS